MSERARVVTREGLEAAAEEMRERVDKDVALKYPWGHLDRHTRDFWRQDTRTVLEAAGIECVNERVEVCVGGGVYAVDDKGNEYNVLFEPSDILYIVRAKAERRVRR